MSLIPVEDGVSYAVYAWLDDWHETSAKLFAGSGSGLRARDEIGRRELL